MTNESRIRKADPPAPDRRVADLEETVRDLRRQQQGLQQSLVKLKSLVESAVDGIVTINGQGVIETFNPAAEKLFGYCRDEVVGRNVKMLMPAPQAGEHDSHLAHYARTGVRKCIGELRERPALRRDGASFPLEISVSEAKTAGGVLFTAILREVEGRRRHEQELLRVQNLESLAILVDGITHHFNNILTAILGNISAARTISMWGAEFEEILKDAEQACLRAKGLTQQLTALAGSPALVKRKVSIPERIEEWVQTALRGSNVASVFSFPKTLTPIEADESQLNQVIRNLVANACQAMPRGGQLTISAETLDAGRQPGLPFPDRSYVRISLRDQGSGVPKEDLARIFVPFFTTRKERSGLGLSVCYAIVRNHGGLITVESEPGVGSVFHVWLPTSSAEPAPARPGRAGPSPSPGKVLVMDDDEAIRKLLSWGLPRIGYEVVTAADGTEAVTLFRKARETGSPFKAVIIDLTVPGELGGKEVMSRLREMDRNVRSIVSSGHVTDPVMRNPLDYGFDEVVAKPYTLDELGGVLSRLLGKP